MRFAIIVCDPDSYGVDSVVDIHGPFDSHREAAKYAKDVIDGPFTIGRMSKSDEDE